MEKIKDDDIKDDYMIIENYDNPDNSLDLKIILEMLEMKKLLFKYKTKIKYYKKHKLNTDHLQTNLINTMDRLNDIKKEAMETYKYNKNEKNNGKKSDNNDKNENNIEKIIILKNVNLKIVIEKLHVVN